MRIPRIYTPQPLAVNSSLDLESGASHHILKVLRMGVGRELRLFNGDGCEYQAAITNSNKKTAHVSITDVVSQPNRSPLYTELAIGLSKGDRLDWILQKATELGVESIRPLFTEHSEVKLSADRIEKKLSSWKQIIIGACEQSQRNTLPELHAPTQLSNFVSTCNTQKKFVLHHRSELSLQDVARPDSVSLLIGPEGGLSEAEIQLAQDHGFLPLALGPRVFRTETAPLASLSILQFLWGDLNQTRN